VIDRKVLRSLRGWTEKVGEGGTWIDGGDAIPPVGEEVEEAPNAVGATDEAEGLMQPRGEDFGDITGLTKFVELFAGEFVEVGFVFLGLAHGDFRFSAIMTTIITCLSLLAMFGAEPEKRGMPVRDLVHSPGPVQLGLGVADLSSGEVGVDDFAEGAIGMQTIDVLTVALV
jgi:hypothetical protein